MLSPARRRAGRLVLWLIGGLVLFAASLVALAALWYWPQLPSLDKVTDYQPRQPLQVFTQDGVELAQFGSERRRFVPLALIPQQLQQAVLAVEDAQFYDHFGISFKGLARAVVARLTGGVPQGASTITQQVARTFFLSTRRTPERKIKEALLALQIEQKLSKGQILELYLNQIYLGQRSYGFGAASLAYFGKPLEALNIAETAMLAGLPQNPIFANPIANPERARRRQLIVLARMRSTGAITEAEQAKAATEKLVYRRSLQVDVHAEYVAEMARQAVVERFGERAYTEGIRVYTSLRAPDQQAAHTALRRAILAHDRKGAYRGPEDHEELPAEPAGAADKDRAAAQVLKDYRDDEDLRVAIVTQASPREVVAQLASGETVRLLGGAQLAAGNDGLRWAQAALAPNAPAALAIKRGSVIRVIAEQRGTASVWQISQWPQADGAFVALDPATGRMRALVGGFDFTHQPFNHVTQAWRQPGSSFKPFLYSAAFEHGLMPETQVNDSPLLNADGSTPEWSPKNSDGRFDGVISLRQALARSRNLVSVRVLKHLGRTAARRWIGRYGFDLNKQPDDLTLALGAGSTTPLQLASAYAVLANGGWRVQPLLIERITDAKGAVIFEAPAPAPRVEADRAIPARNVFMTSSLLNEVVRSGTAARVQAALQRPDLYGKTGTTNDSVDAWFAGFHPSLVAVVWIGHDDPTSLGVGETGGGVALPAWIDFMSHALRGVPRQNLATPGGVVMGTHDWRYAEWSGGGFVEQIGVDVPAAAPAQAASASANPSAATAER